MARSGTTSTPHAARRAARESSRLPLVGGLRERNKQEKLERIERAARVLFTQKGFDGTTTREIAYRARVGAGTLFLYAKDKRELLLRMLERDCQRATEEAYASLPRAKGLLAAVLHTFVCMFDHHARARDLARIFMKELLFFGAQDIGAIALGDLQRLADLVERAQQRGEVRADVAPLIAATNFFSIYYFTLNSWLGGYFTMSTARSLMHDALELQIRGLQRAPSKTRATEQGAGRSAVTARTRVRRNRGHPGSR